MKLKLRMPEVHDMTADTVDLVSTSSVTADASPIVLNQTDMCRLRFLPTLVKNENEPHKSVSGKLMYEKKHKYEDAFPSDGNTSDKKVSRGSVKVENWMEFQFDTSETYELYVGL